LINNLLAYPVTELSIGSTKCYSFSTSKFFN